MAEVTVKLPDEFLKKLTRLGEQTDAICTKMLEAGAEVVEAKIRENLQAVIGSGTQEPSRSTGELLESLGTSDSGRMRTASSISKSASPNPARTVRATPRSLISSNMASTASRPSLS